MRVNLYLRLGPGFFPTVGLRFLWPSATEGHFLERLEVGTAIKSIRCPKVNMIMVH
jgi:hypothetical protein